MNSPVLNPERWVAFFEVIDDCGEVTGAFDRGARRPAQINAEFARDDMGERGFAEARRPREENVVEDLAAHARRLDRHAENFFEALLADELRNRARAQRKVELAFLLAGRGSGKFDAGGFARRTARYLPGSVQVINSFLGSVLVSLHFSPSSIASDLRISASRPSDIVAGLAAPTESTARLASAGL